MGKFINTVTGYSQMVSQAADIMKNRLDNPYYLFTDKKASECTYYNINTTMSTLDESTRGNYSEISVQSPIRYNKIKNFLIYGISRIEPSLEIGEFGLESDNISGDIIILPRTIIPYPEDYFYLTQLGKSYLFKVTGVNPNTLDTGATLYRVNYSLKSSDGLKKIEEQVVKTYIFNFSSGGGDNGSNMSTSIIDEDVYNNTTELQEYVCNLKDFYINMFYDSRIQNFTYFVDPHTKSWYSTNGVPKPSNIGLMQDVSNKPFGIKVYDAYLIEFIIRNKILEGSSEYIYVDQSMYLPQTFALDYSQTFFSSLEEKSIEKHYGYNVGNLLLCDQRLSLLYAFPENYYYMKYGNLNARLYYISIFDDPEFISKIKSNTSVEDPFKNLIIKYFNDIKITKEDIDKLQHIDLLMNREYYYIIPMVIYILEQHISSYISKATMDT